MSLHGDLIHQARRLANQESKRPKQASLRRAVSTAYYALFHFLVDRACRRLVRGGGRDALRNLLARAFDHGEMSVVARSFAGGTPKAHVARALAGVGVSPALRTIARTFVRLQEARHAADYDRGATLTRREAIDLVNSAELAMEAWSPIQDTVEADTFLVALLVQRRADR